MYSVQQIFKDPQDQVWVHEAFRWNTLYHRVICVCVTFGFVSGTITVWFYATKFLHSSEMIACWEKKDCKIYSLKSGCWHLFSWPSVYFLRVHRLFKKKKKTPRCYLSDKGWKLWKDCTLGLWNSWHTWKENMMIALKKNNNVLLSVFWVF